MTTNRSTRTYSHAYGDDYQARHAAEVAQREAERQELARQNETLRQQRLAAIAAEREAQARQHEALIEQALSGRKEVEKRAWLAEHPTQSAADFETRAWPHLRANILTKEREEGLRYSVERLRASGEYRL